MFAMILAVTIGVLVGARSARKRDGPFDVVGRFFGVITYAAPVFWLGILAQLLFAVKLGWLPTGNRVLGRRPRRRPRHDRLLPPRRGHPLGTGRSSSTPSST